jgi:integrase
MATFQDNDLQDRIVNDFSTTICRLNDAARLRLLRKKEGQPMKLTPKIMPRGKQYMVQFRHPRKNMKSVTEYLGTDDLTHAETICFEACRLFNNQAVLQAPTPESVNGFDRRAVELVFGKELADELIDGTEAKKLTLPAISQEDIDKLLVRAETLRDGNDAAKFVVALLDKTGFSFQNFALLLEEYGKQNKAFVVLTEKYEEATRELAQLKRQRNAGIKVTVGQAFEKYARHYPTTVTTERTVDDTIGWVEDFISSLPMKKDMLIADISKKHLNEWIGKLRREDGEPLAPGTANKRRSCVSNFMKFIYHEYDLSENPMEKARRIEGASRSPEQIRAIRRVYDLNDYLEALKPYPYWRAWVAFAVLAGPRWCEQRRLRIDDVYLDTDCDYVHIATITSGRRKKGTKTGKERKIAIERTVLKPILKEHLALRKAQRRSPDASPAERTNLLFPSPIQQRKDGDGMWCGSSNFNTNWCKIVGAITGFKPPEKPELPEALIRRADSKLIGGLGRCLDNPWWFKVKYRDVNIGSRP